MKLLLPFLCGTACGVLSAWGVGGGTLLLLLMTLLLGVPVSDARGINLLYFLPVAAGSLGIHRKNGYLDREVFRTAVPWGVAAAVAAAWIVSRVDPAVVKKPFGLLLLWAGGTMLLSKGDG